MQRWKTVNHDARMEILGQPDKGVIVEYFELYLGDQTPAQKFRYPTEELAKAAFNRLKSKELKWAALFHRQPNGSYKLLFDEAYSWDR